MRTTKIQVGRFRRAATVLLATALLWAGGALPAHAAEPLPGEPGYEPPEEGESTEPSASPTPSQTPSPTPTSSPSPTASPSPTPSPTPTPTPSQRVQDDEDTDGAENAEGTGQQSPAPRAPNDSLRSGDEPWYSPEDASGFPWLQPFDPFSPSRPLEEPPPPQASPDEAARPQGPRSTQVVMETLEGEPPEKVARALAPFPVAGWASYDDGWAPTQAVPGIAAGQGTAIFAAAGTPVVAAANGPVRTEALDPGWGTAVELVGPDGTIYRYGHLERLAAGVAEGAGVRRGQIIGYVGVTGVRDGDPYLYFQLELADGRILDPVPFLDRWLIEAGTISGVIQEAADQVRILGGAKAPQVAGADPLGDETGGSELLETLFGLAVFGGLGAWWLRRRRPAWLLRIWSRVSRKPLAPALPPVSLDTTSTDPTAVGTDVTQDA